MAVTHSESLERREPEHGGSRRALESVFSGVSGLALGALLVIGLLAGCELIPTKPESVFILYRDRMKAEKIAEARELLSEESKQLAVKLARDYHLKQPPENLALLNVLDPVSPPLSVKSEDTEALLQLRGLKGGMRHIKLVRRDADAPWKIDITSELKALQNFLGAQRALDTMREQASEYAASWKAFSTQLQRMKVPASNVGKQGAEKTVGRPMRSRELLRRRTTRASGGSDFARRRGKTREIDVLRPKGLE
jgi:hypothetical protein